MISLNTNISDLILINSLNSSTNGINKTIERLTTGYKLNHAKDNAAGLSIVTDLTTRINSLLKVQNNTEDGISLLSTAQGALEEIQDKLARLKELSIQAANGTYGSQSLQAMQAEADEIVNAIKQIRDNTEFNGLKLFESAKKETTVTKSAVSKLANYTVKSSSNSVVRRSAPQARAASTVISGAVDIAGSETQTITIDNITYTLKNRENVAKTISYSKDTSSGEITFFMNNIELRGEVNKAHNIIINGVSNYVYGGNLDDKFHITGANNGASHHNVIYGGAGNDSFSSDCRYATFYGEAGDDYFYITQGETIAHGGAGDDTFETSTGSLSVVTLNGNDGEDRFYIKATSVNRVTVDGGAGTNYAESTSSNTVLINVPNANASILSFTGSQTKTVAINGLNYTIKNNSGNAQNLSYKINSDGTIVFNSANFTITADKTQKHKVELKQGLTYYAGDMGDTIKSTTDSVTVYGGNGDDNITIYSWSHVFAGEGNNTITVAGGFSHITAGNGNNTFNFTNSQKYTAIEFGDGDNKIQNAQNLKYSSIIGGSGTNTITGSGFDSTSMVAGFGSLDNAQIFRLEASGTSKLTINDIEYSITRNGTRKGINSLLYRVNDVTGDIEFGGQYLNIRGALDKAHSVTLAAGFRLNFWGGNLNDTITTNAGASVVYGGAGDDTIVSNGSNSTMYGEDGNDTITVNGGSTNVYGGAGDDIINVHAGNGQYTVNGQEGNDTYNIDAQISVVDTSGNNIYNVNTSNISITGGTGNDTFYVKGSNNIILGGGGDDYIVVDGKSNTIDGGTGDNYFVDNGEDSTLNNIEKDPNSGVLMFSSVGEKATFELDGKVYTVTNKSTVGTSVASNQLKYSFNPNTKVITIEGSNFTVDSDLNQSHKLNIRGDGNVINGGNLVDTIVVEQGSNNLINTLKGNDSVVLDSENNAVSTGDGDDTITLNASTNKLIDGGNGNDTIIVNSSNNTNISAGNGDDTLNVNGSNNTIKAGNGNNNINIRSDKNTVTAGSGDNSFSIVGDSNNITAGSGKNKTGVDGNSNIINVVGAEGSINIIGENNKYTSQNGAENISIRGNNNNVNSGRDTDKVEVRGDNNTVSNVSGKKDVNIRGNENIYNGSPDVDSVTVTGDNNTIKGGDSNDSFMISKGDSNNVDGQGGDRNTIINNGDNTTFSNAVDITPNPFELTLKIDLGSGANSFINLSISFNLFDFYLDFSDPANLEDNLDQIEFLNSQVEEQLVNISSTINRLESVLESQSIQLENLMSSRSTLRDADIAKESSNLIKYQILQEASATLMSSTRNINAEFILGILAR